MRIPLDTGTVIRLNEIGTAKVYDFKIEELIGMGGSCIVYTAVYTDSEGNRFSVRLKEFYPEWLAINRENLSLTVSDDQQEDFSESLQQFTDGYQKQMQFREMTDSMNSIANIQGIYEGNGTKYIAMSCQNAVPLNTDMPLYDIFRVLRAVTLQIANFHDNGYLYLDLKPQNVMMFPETPEMVMLFDFDSAVHMGEIQPNHLSCTDSWAPPELLQRKFREIGVQTDIYGIGALLVYLLFNRSPRMSDRRRGASWDNELDNSIVSSEKPEIRRMITEIFRQTLNANPQKRFSSCDDMLDLIEPYIEENQNPKPYLKTFLPLGNNFFCGRNKEIQEIHDALSHEHFLILHGIGGIGKSELAKHYALSHSEDYDAVVFVRFRKSIIDTVVLDSNLPIVNCIRSEDEEDEEYFERKIKVLQDICTPRHLIIIDNFDTDNCDNIDALMQLPCKILVTSRVDYADTFPQYELNVIDNYNDLYSIITYYYKANIDEDNTAAIENIISAVLGHTMALELIAKHMQAMNITPVEMYDLLEQNGITAGDSGKVRGFKDGNLKNNTAYAHIAALFNIFGLSEDMKQILRYAALFGPTPIVKQGFIALTGLTEVQIKTLDSAIQYGWLQLLSYETDYNVKLHPLISEVLCNELKPDAVQCEAFVIMAHLYTDCLVDMDSEQRAINIEWLDHMAHNIHGISEELSKFYYFLCHNVYLDEHDFESMDWCAERVFEILSEMNLTDQYEERIVMVFSTVRAAAYRVGDMDRYSLYTDKLHKIGTEYALEQIPFMDYTLHLEECDYEAAEQDAKEYLEFVIRSNDDLKIAKAYSDLAAVEKSLYEHNNMAEYHAKAIEHMNRYIAEHSDDFADDPDALAELYDSEADIYKECENFELALDCYEKALKIKENVHGEKSGSVDMLYWSIGLVYLEMQDYDQGIIYLNTALEISKKTYGQIHEENIPFYLHLYSAYIKKWHDLDDISALEQAAALMPERIEMQCALTGEVSRETAALYMEYSDALRFLDEKGECFENMKIAMRIYDALLDKDDPQWIDIYCCACDSFVYYNENEKAVKVLKKAILLCKQYDYAEEAKRLEEFMKTLI